MDQEDNRNRIWNLILERLQEKLQYGVIEQTKFVTDARVEGSQLILEVTSEDAKEYFNAEVNQQRLIILARPEITLLRVTAILVA